MNNQYEVGDSDTRPWGRWIVESAGSGYTVKKITVNPEACLSLQRHEFRYEHWIIVAGQAEVTLGDRTINCGPNDVVSIKKELLHRIRNSGVEPLVFIEVQIGDILDETDIERIADIYDRV